MADIVERYLDAIESHDWDVVSECVADGIVRAAYLHMMADALGSVGAVIAGAVLWFTDWRPIDCHAWPHARRTRRRRSRRTTRC